jgi:HlyD family secretion protein
MKKRYLVGAVVLVVLALVLYLRSTTSDMPLVETVAVERGTVRNEVSVTGYARPLERVDLAFLTGGRVESVYVTEGALVTEGDILARLDVGVLESQVREAEARLVRERALEADLLAPLRTEERAVKDTAVRNAEASVAQAELAVRAAVSRAFTYADDAIREETDEVFNGGTQKFGTSFTYGSTQYFLNTDAQTRADLTAARVRVEDALTRMEERMRAPEGETETLLADTDADLRIIETFLADVARVVNKYVQTDTAEQAVYDAYQTTVASARAGISTARSDVLAARKEHQAASTALAGALRDLDLSLAGASSEALAAQRASVLVAERGVERAVEQLRDATLYAPFAGVVTNVDLTKGEVVTAYAPVGQLIADAGFELEVYIPEADIATVQTGDMARVTFDAFDRTNVFTAKVVRIAIAETMKEGVPTYKTTLIITQSPDESLMIRSGMTADIDIMTEGRDDVLYVPTRSIITGDGRVFVRVQNGSDLEERTVVPGLRGSDGFTEIVSGLTEGEDVVLYIEEP